MSKRRLGISILLLIAGILPLLLQLPYFFNAWSISPLDRHDWLFIVFAIVAFSLIAFWKRPAYGWDFRALVGMLIGAVIFGIGLKVGIHAIQILGAIILSWSMTWCVLGWDIGFRTLPAFILLLGITPGTNYWLGILFQPGGFVLKLIFSSLCLLIVSLTAAKQKMPTPFAFAFALLSIGLLCGVLFTSTSSQQPALVPDFNAIKAPKGMFVRYLHPTPADARIFGNNHVQRFLFATTEATIDVLTVKNTGDVQCIHPPGHCLNMSGWEILSKEAVNIHLGGRNIQISELRILRAGEQQLVWSWYSNVDCSTSSYISFRHLRGDANDWCVYQLVTPMKAGIFFARERLLSLVKCTL
ncbi:MAG: exosortase-associated EpsI family protein [Kiritimatiellia bacterium]